MFLRSASSSERGKKVSRFTTLMLAAVLFVFSTATVLGRQTTFDPSEKGSITVSLLDSETGKAVDGAELTLYRVASVNSSAGPAVRYTVTSSFAGFDLDSYDLKGTALTEDLMKFVTEKGMRGKTLKTEDGKASFTDLQTGLYFITEEDSSEKYYPIVPFIVAVPMTNSEGNSWIFDVEADPKVQPKPVEPAEFVDITVRKTWLNTIGNQPAPESVQVALFCDGAFFEKVTVKKSEGWKYTWKSLPKDKTWNVYEVEIPQGYKATYSQTGNEFTITNQTDTTSGADVSKTVPQESGGPSTPTILGIQANHFYFFAGALVFEVAVVVFLIVFFKKRRNKDVEKTE